MADSAPATLTADMMAPTNSLMKDFEQIRGKMTDVEKTAERGVAAENKALDQKSAEIGRQREETKKFGADHPFPHPDIKPWTQKPPENNPMESFGSWASAFGILAGAITKTGLASSLNASAAAMQAFRKNDLDAYNEAKQAWKDNTEAAIQNAEWESKGYKAAFDLMQSDQSAGLAQMEIVATQAQNTVALAKIKSGNLKDIWDMAQGMATFASQGPQRMLQMQELATKMEDTKARAELLAQAYTDDAKLPQDKQMTPEQKAQLRTRIMNPQYTINQAKAIAEGAGGKGSLADDPVALDYWATRVRAGEPIPPLGIGKDAALSRRLIAARAAHMADDAGDSAGKDIMNRALLHSEKGSLDQLVKQQNAIHQFEQTALANGQAALDLIDKVDSTGIPVVERWIRAGRKNVAGDPDVSKFNTQLGVFLPEVAKILNNPNLGGVLSDSAREETQSLIPQNVTGDQLRAIIPLLERDFGRRDKAITDEVGVVKDTIEQLGSGNLGKSDTDKGAAGGKSFPDEAAAQKAVDEGKVKVGDTVMIGGKAHKVSE